MTHVAELKPLSARGRECAGRKYRDFAAFFPLVAAVLDGSQQGRALGDNADEPTQAYVEHAFGFAQIFGDISEPFANALSALLLADHAFTPLKIRLYTPWQPNFLAGSAGEPFRSERRRFTLDRRRFAERYSPSSLPLTPVTFENIGVVENAFQLCSRFWPDLTAFVNNSLGRVVWQDGAPAAICYAAAIADNRAEIDVLTLAPYRMLGLGFAAAASFCMACLEKGIEPLWDCFTNNAGSLGLAASLGFTPQGAPYPFYTIPR